jgi:1-deoxy-D-xylulose-5-phosphate synthase
MNAPEVRYELLESIHSPADLRRLSRADLHKLADELRRFLVESVSKTGGHLSSNLGTVELTVALHYILKTPHDRLVWDVGHQTYVHKILTGRLERMAKLRMWGGISGFPRRCESEYDTFGTAHASTSISAALGMAAAAKRRGDTRRCVAVIGDGAMTGGMAFEALNNAGAMDANLLVVLNDNDMSISRNVGALHHYLARLLSGRVYSAARRSAEKVLGALPSPVLELAKKAEEHVKGMVTPGTLFEEFGFNYIGPIDGHDIDVLVETLSNVVKLDGPQFLHVVTRKGKGYKLAEDDCILYHGVSRFDPEHGIVSKSSSRPTYTEIFGEWLCDMAECDPRLIGITPAMREGSGLVRFAERFPERYFDVGIAEQHCVTFAAGIACEGMKPVVAIYSTFLQRAYDQLIHDVAIQNLPVVFAIDRGGVVGADGATHNGGFDLSYMRCIPNLTVMTPADENECRQMLYTAFQMQTPAAVRYPRGTGVGVPVQKQMTALPVGRGEIRREGRDIAILAFGTMLTPALAAADELDATVVNMRFVKPLDEALVLELASRHSLLVTVEENTAIGGAGSGVAEFLAACGVAVPILILGLPDVFLEQGDPAILLRECGLTREGIVERVRARRASGPQH